MGKYAIDGGGVVMKKHSDYLNPFQPFAELHLKANSDGRPRDAIENNMSRAVFSALANSEPQIVAEFIAALATHARSAGLREQMQHLTVALRNTDATDIEFGLQTWPKLADHEWHSLKVLLVGLSSSHERDWSHDQRDAPESPCADAWIHVPGKLLLVFECKNDEHPLDATQISAYAHALKLVDEALEIPRAERGKSLESFEQARQVQAACANIVLDVPWSAVVDALTSIMSEPKFGHVGRWLCEQARDYIQRHVRPPYRGIQTILEWLGGPDSLDRRTHLRRLVAKLGASLKDGPVTFATKEDGDWEFGVGAGAAVFVRLLRDGKPLTQSWLAKKADAQIWFHFTDDTSARIGLGYYVQAKGSQANSKDEVAWNLASERHINVCAAALENELSKWIVASPTDSKLIVSSVRFRGSKTNWQGGGESDLDFQPLRNATPREALEFLQSNRARLWCFPKVGLASETGARTIAEAARLVRKPDLEITAPMYVDSFTECGDNPLALQAFFRTALNGVAPCA